LFKYKFGLLFHGDLHRPVHSQLDHAYLLTNNDSNLVGCTYLALLSKMTFSIYGPCVPKCPQKSL
jgi:hypothetical protein